MSDAPEYYELVPVYPVRNAFSLVNASVGLCGLCGKVTTGMGGSDNQICVQCAEVVMRGQARGAIVWEEPPAVPSSSEG